MTLTIEGEDMETSVVEVSLSTMTAEFSVTPGIRTMTLLVGMNIPGLPFTSTQTIYMPPGGIGNLDFDLEINAPPQDVSVTASATTTYKNTPVTITAYANELDPEDEPTVTWDGGGAVYVQGFDEDNTVAALRPGFRTVVRLGEPPAEPFPIEPGRFRILKKIPFESLMKKTTTPQTPDEADQVTMFARRARKNILMNSIVRKVSRVLFSVNAVSFSQACCMS